MTVQPAPEARVAEGWQPHSGGRHHYAPCGEYRPVSSQVRCDRCGDVCLCGTRYHRREET